MEVNESANVGCGYPHSSLFTSIVFQFAAKTVLIHSQGTAFEHQKNSLGLFHIEGFSNGKPYYKKKSEETYLHWSSDSFWKVRFGVIFSNYLVESVSTFMFYVHLKSMDNLIKRV